ncbi:hypothetical protein EMIT0P253_10367 [Pseudomonas sp. IT-P253]
MTPFFRIVADGADITALINDRLLLLRTSDKPGMESDEFELRIDDRDGQVRDLPGLCRNVPGAPGALCGGHGRGVGAAGHDRDQGEGQRYAGQWQDHPERQLGGRAAVGDRGRHRGAQWLAAGVPGGDESRSGRSAQRVGF